MRTERVTAPAANLAFVLYGELRRLFVHNDGRICRDEQAVLDQMQALVQHTDRADATVSLLAAGLGERGVDSPHFRRRLREHDADTASPRALAAD